MEYFLLFPDTVERWKLGIKTPQSRSRPQLNLCNYLSSQYFNQLLLLFQSLNTFICKAKLIFSKWKKTYLVDFFPMPRQPIGKIFDLGVTKRAKKKVKRCQTWRNKILGISIRSGLKGLEIRPCLSMINNGNRTDRSPIRSAIIRVINKIGLPRSGDPIY